jgi:hypothetical protein
MRHTGHLCRYVRSSYSITEPTAAVTPEIRAQVLADAIALKKSVIYYLHPELPVNATDASAKARCYFDRSSAPEVESVENTEIRAPAIVDMAVMKKSAVHYMHPELPVLVTDSFAKARCYFDRPSTPEVESFEDADRAQVIADMISLKKLAADYMHPELNAAVIDPSATTRCYFDRHSADVSTFISHVSVMSAEEVVRARSDTAQSDLEDDVFHDMKNRFTRCCPPKYVVTAGRAYPVKYNTALMHGHPLFKESTLSSQTSLSNLILAQSITLTLQHGILPAFTAWYNQPLQYSMIALLPLNNTRLVRQCPSQAGSLLQVHVQSNNPHSSSSRIITRSNLPIKPRLPPFTSTSFHNTLNPFTSHHHLRFLNYCSSYHPLRGCSVSLS